MAILALVSKALMNFYYPYNDAHLLAYILIDSDQ